MSERVLVIGAGIGGLCTALALAPTGRAVTLVDRDEAPASDDPDAVFQDWRHTGVSHLRQSHAFLARLRTIIKSEHPRLLNELLALGVRELPFDAMLTDLQRPRYTPAPEDADLTIITSRRTTLELAMRRYVQSLPNVTIETGLLVRRLVTQKGADGVIEVTGIEGERAGAPVTLSADIVVDSSGKSGFTLEQLREEGATIAEEAEPAGILYFTRHYRLRPGMSEPPRAGAPPGTGDLGFLKFGVFPGDNGCFSITIAIPEVEMELRKAILDPDVFHRITLLLPGLEPWTNEGRSEGVGRVYGMGDLVSRWRDLVVEGKPAARGYFALGDTLVRTNPLYGRGCSFAAVSAQALRQALDASADPTARLVAFQEKLYAELRPFYLSQRRQDRSAIKRARFALTPGAKRTLRSKLMESFVEDGVRIAVRSDVNLLREAMRGFHMLEDPEKWLGRPNNLAKVLLVWARGKRANAKAYPPKPGPDREEMLAAIGVDAQADVVRLAQAA
ncbi:MAG: FAD-dependent oxidoreductase [Alphaproteobacteria bacterium]|nr:FAD-dependent oxidoreductase [Alphaproteobacteria bacterium]